MGLINYPNRGSDMRDLSNVVFPEKLFAGKFLTWQDKRRLSSIQIEIDRDHPEEILRVGGRGLKEVLGVIGEFVIIDPAYEEAA